MKYELKRDEIGKLRLTLEMEFESLGSAMEALNVIERHGGKPSLSPLELELLPMIRSGELLRAVKHYKDVTSEGLKESKEYCDALRDKLQRMQLI